MVNANIKDIISIPALLQWQIAALCWHF